MANSIRWKSARRILRNKNRLTDIQAQSQMFIQNASDYNKSRQEVSTQLELANAMLEYISSGSSTDLLSANLGIEENGVNQQITEYNNLVLERNGILAGSSEINPIVIRLDSQLDQIKGNVVASLRNLRSNLRISQDELNR